MTRVTATFLAPLLLATSALADPAPRVPLAQEPLRVLADYEQRLVVKFLDDVRARATEAGEVVSQTGRDLSPIESAAARHSLRFDRLIVLPEEKLTGLEQRAALGSGRAQPDLAGILLVEIGDPSTSLETAARALQGLEGIEWVSLEAVRVPPPFDIAPPSGDLVPSQGHLLGNPGVNSDFAWTWGATGQGVRISDCEYGWVPTHEDVNEIDLHLEPGQTVHPDVASLGWDQHGAAAFGVSTSMVNGYGCNGMTPDAEFYTYPEWTVEEGFRRTTCITNAIANSSAGDVVLLEMQTSILGGTEFGPAELNLSVWTVVKAGTDAGVVVVGAAGNGNQDLDSAPYADYMNRGDSGAILVGAGTDFFDHAKLSFSTYGSRVDVQSWGRSVTTLGYGDVAYNGTDQNQYYTTGFSGTSSASAIVAPACALVQSFQLFAIGTPLTSVEMRQLLIDTGWPQQNEAEDGHIGPAVNVKKLLRQNYPPVAAPEIESGEPALSLEVHPNPFRATTTIRFRAPQASADLAVEIIDVTGRRVRFLLQESTLPGSVDRVPWDGRDALGRALPSGVYFVKVSAGGRIETQRIVRLN